jgi:translocation protein SEC66
MAQNTHIRERLNEILATAPTEREWWDKRRADIQAELLGEVDEEKKTPLAEAGGDDDAVLVEGGGPADKSGKAKKKKGKQ